MLYPLLLQVNFKTKGFINRLVLVGGFKDRYRDVILAQVTILILLVSAIIVNAVSTPVGLGA